MDGGPAAMRPDLKLSMVLSEPLDSRDVYEQIRSLLLSVLAHHGIRTGEAAAVIKVIGRSLDLKFLVQEKDGGRLLGTAELPATGATSEAFERIHRTLGVAPYEEDTDLLVMTMPVFEKPKGQSH